MPGYSSPSRNGTMANHKVGKAAPAWPVSKLEQPLLGEDPASVVQGCGHGEGLRARLLVMSIIVTLSGQHEAKSIMLLHQ